MFYVFMHKAACMVTKLTGMTPDVHQCQNTDPEVNSFIFEVI